MRLTIPGRLPGMNDILKAPKGNRFRANQIKREAETKVAWCILQQLRGVEVKDKVTLRYTWYEENRRRDLDNIASGHKYVQDALVKAGVLEGDGWRHIAGFSDGFEVDKVNPRVEVEIIKAR